jgi:hypothetical protein
VLGFYPLVPHKTGCLWFLTDPFIQLDHMQPLEDCAQGCYTPHSEVAQALRRAKVL